MSATVSMQMVDRGHTRSFYLNFPAALADVMDIKKGEKFEWILEDKNTVWLRRLNKITLRKLPKTVQK